MIIFSLMLTAVFLAYANGANDNFKGVATLFGSGTASYRIALGWACLTTFAGSLSAVWLSAKLVAVFSGKGLVPDALAATPSFLVSVGLGAAVTVVIATWLGLPISTTHSLTGALVGAGLAYGPVSSGVLGATVGKSVAYSSQKSSFRLASGSRSQAKLRLKLMSRSLI